MDERPIKMRDGIDHLTFVVVGEADIALEMGRALGIGDRAGLFQVELERVLEVMDRLARGRRFDCSIRTMRSPRSLLKNAV